VQSDREEKRGEQKRDCLDPQQNTDRCDEHDLAGEGQAYPAIDLELFDLARIAEHAGHLEQRKQQEPERLSDC